MILRHCSDSDHLPPPCPSVTVLLSSKASRLGSSLGLGLGLGASLLPAGCWYPGLCLPPASLGLGEGLVSPPDLAHPNPALSPGLRGSEVPGAGGAVGAELSPLPTGQQEALWWSWCCRVRGTEPPPKDGFGGLPGAAAGLCHVPGPQQVSAPDRSCHRCHPLPRAATRRARGREPGTPRDCPCPRPPLPAQPLAAPQPRRAWGKAREKARGSLGRAAGRGGRPERQDSPQKGSPGKWGGWHWPPPSPLRCRVRMHCQRREQGTLSRASPTPPRVAQGTCPPAVPLPRHPLPLVSPHRCQLRSPPHPRRRPCSVLPILLPCNTDGRQLPRESPEDPRITKGDLGNVAGPHVGRKRSEMCRDWSSLVSPRHLHLHAMGRRRALLIALAHCGWQQHHETPESITPSITPCTPPCVPLSGPAQPGLPGQHPQ